MGYYYDSVGDYVGALWLVAGLAFLAAILIALLRDYPDEDSFPIHDQ